MPEDAKEQLAATRARLAAAQATIETLQRKLDAMTVCYAVVERAMAKLSAVVRSIDQI